MDLKAEARRLAEGACNEIDRPYRTRAEAIEDIVDALLAFGRLVREEDAKVCASFAFGADGEKWETAHALCTTLLENAKSLE